MIEEIEMTNKVNPDRLEEWLVNNPEKVYKRSVETAIYLSENKDLIEESFMEFMWENEVYSKIYMKRSAQKAKLAKESFEKNQ